jgi:hypothetical protein
MEIPDSDSTCKFWEDVAQNLVDMKKDFKSAVYNSKTPIYVLRNGGWGNVKDDGVFTNVPLSVVRWMDIEALARKKTK